MKQARRANLLKAPYLDTARPLTESHPQKKGIAK